MSEALDFSSLAWVRHEIQKNLEKIRQTLERALDAGEPPPVEEARQELRQIQGTLEMIGIQGAILLTQELDALLEDLSEHPGEREEDTYEVLMETFLVLSHYLEWSQQHRQDIPLAVLPYMNKLRRARGAPPLKEQDLFQPELSAEPPPPPSQAPAIQELIPRLRPAYEKTLLHWLRRDTPQAPLLKEWDAILETLQQAHQPRESARLWWIARGILEAMQQDALEPDLSLQHLLGELDHQLRLLQQGRWDQDQSLPLARELLFHLARTSAHGPLVSSIKHAFRLEALLPSQETLEA
ncbi:MAG: hypothetical protein D6819_00220, partial [Gammaproteobacteria bacterium]